MVPVRLRGRVWIDRIRKCMLGVEDPVAGVVKTLFLWDEMFPVEIRRGHQVLWQAKWVWMGITRRLI